MNTPTPSNSLTSIGRIENNHRKNKPPGTVRTLAVSCLITFAATWQAFCASQTWSNAPTDNNWTNINNWNGLAAPGAVNSTGNGDTATFNAPIPQTGIGGVSQPITNDVQRGIRNVLFDTANCGAYVFGSNLVDNSLEIIHLGNITVNPAVANPITFNQGVRFRVPNSTNGRYDFTNNASSPNAAIYIGCLTNSTANTRPLVMFLGGSNTGTNTIAHFDDANGGAVGSAGAILLDKVGSGTWILSGPNDLPQKTSAGNIARVQVIDGTLIVKDVAALGAISAANLLVTNTGVLQIDGITPQNLGFGLRSGGTIRMNGTGGINGLVVGNQSALSATLRTTSASDVFTVGSPGVSVISGGAADSVLNFNGPGTMVLGAANTYIGKWSFNSGTNKIGDLNALGTAPIANISAGAILDTTIFGPSTYALTTASLSANGTGTAIGSNAATILADPAGTVDLASGSRPLALSFTPSSFSGDITHPALFVAQGTLSLGGNSFAINNASGTPLGAGTYRLIQQASGNITSAGGYAVVVGGSGLAPGAVPAIQVINGEVDLIVTIYVAKNLVWTGGNPDTTWNANAGGNNNWLNGAQAVAFTNSDNATFNSIGSANPTVSLSGAIQPSSVTVDTSANNYTFNGAGIIAGTTGLKKLNPGTLLVQVANTYSGGTVVSNGTVQLGIDNAIPGSGSATLDVYSPGVIDMNGFADTISGLTGNGTIDILSGGISTLTVGNNNASSTFGGLLKNTSGTLGLTKAGNGQFTLLGAHTFAGPTTINAGTLEVRDPNALGSGASPVTINGGSLRTTTSLNLSNLTGATVGTSIANATGAGATKITHTGAGNFTGVISDGASGTVSVYIPSGTLQLNAINTYNGGTIVASGATLASGVINAAVIAGQPGSGGIIASNGATISMPTAVSTAAAIPNPITNIDANGTITLSSLGQANNFNGQFFGGANNTNIFVGPMSVGGASSFSNFPGTVVVSNAASFRWFVGNGGLAGGDNTIFDIRGTMFSRDQSTIRLGVLVGDGALTAPSVTPPATFLIGGKNVGTVFSGVVQGSNNITKIGSAELTLNGTALYTNTVTLPDNSVVDFTLLSNRVTYTGITTVSNGTLRIIAPNNLTNSSAVTLAGGSAVLDVSSSGFLTNQTTLDINTLDQPTNTVVVTNGTLEILAGQSLNGQGSILGTVICDTGSTNNIGMPIGTLSIGGSATLNSVINMDLNRANSPATNDMISASSINVSGTVNITNVGPDLVTGDTYKLFSVPVSGTFAAVNLPLQNQAGTITYVWANRLDIDGTIQVLSGASSVSSSPTNITAAFAGNTLDLSWPADHTGWTMQTNSIGITSTGSWFPLPGSAATNHVIVTVDRTRGNVFYRLVYQ
jgi:autotransporter-associated beta strand protein